MSVKLEWKGNMKFAAYTPSGHEVMLDSSINSGGEDTAARPMELLLVSLVGCTAMDVISILKKMKAFPENFRVEVEYERAPEHPKIYTKIHLKYIFKNAPSKAKAEKAVELSQNKYCSVSAMLKKASDLTYELVFD
ncbi:OsmC family protein [Mesoaciditoga lauensis]|uniref:OsmC family protein n=1 Tax=Mesoaciditoga lauensis TaxID=1495039 RepID=UPI000559BCD1|nr:OsmC family protein [Mesoaciditoga lauensis]